MINYTNGQAIQLLFAEKEFVVKAKFINLRFEVVFDPWFARTIDSSLTPPHYWELIPPTSKYLLTHCIGLSERIGVLWRWLLLYSLKFSILFHIEKQSDRQELTRSLEAMKRQSSYPRNLQKTGGFHYLKRWAFQASGPLLFMNCLSKHIPLRPSDHRIFLHQLQNRLDTPI